MAEASPEKEASAKRWRRVEVLTVDPALTPHAKCVAMLLEVRYRNARSGKAWPSVARLASELSMTDKTVKSALKALVRLGWLEKRRQGGGRDTNGYGRTSIYTASDRRLTALLAEGYCVRKTPVAPRPKRPPLDDERRQNIIAAAGWHLPPGRA